MRLSGARLSTLALVLTACSPGPGGPMSEAALVVAENAGPVLAVVSLTPGEVGMNDVRLDLFVSSDHVARRARVALSTGGRAAIARAEP